MRETVKRGVPQNPRNSPGSATVASSSVHSRLLMLFVLSSHIQLLALVFLHSGESAESVCPGSTEVLRLPIPPHGHSGELD